MNQREMNFLRPERDALRRRARLDYMDAVSAKWKVDLDAMIARARETHGKRVPKEVLDQLRAQFWAGVDRHLDEAEAAARAALKRKA